MYNIKMIKKQLQELGFNHNETKVYIALTQLGEARAVLVAKKADLPRTTAISILQKLEKEGYITVHKHRGKSIFWIESPHMLKNVFMSKVKMADDLYALLTDLYRSESDFPYAKIYDSKSSIKSFVKRIILQLENKSEICTIENPNFGNYSKIFSEEFFYSMLAMKKEKDIITRSLVTTGSIKNINPQKLQKQSITLREMPEKIDFKASFWIIDDMLVLFSGKYPFIVSIHHRIISSSMKSIFDYLWSISIKN